MRSGPEGIGNHRSEEPGKRREQGGKKINGEEKKGVERRRKEEDIDKAAFLFLSILNRDGRHHTHTHTHTPHHLQKFTLTGPNYSRPQRSLFGLPNSQIAHAGVRCTKKPYTHTHIHTC